MGGEALRGLGLGTKLRKLSAGEQQVAWPGKNHQRCLDFKTMMNDLWDHNI